MREKRWLIVERISDGKTLVERLIPDGYIGDRNMEETLNEFGFVIVALRIVPRGNLAALSSNDGVNRVYFKVDANWKAE